MSRGSSPWFGDVQRLPSGNTLIDYSASGRIQVVNPSDEVVLEIRSSVENPNYLGYVEFRESLYGMPLDIQQ